MTRCEWCRCKSRHRSAFAFLLDTLFITPSYREHHGRPRDEILARLEPATP